jgi:hypothetical protein
MIFPQKRRLEAVKWRRWCESRKQLIAEIKKQPILGPSPLRAFYFSILERDSIVPGDLDRVIHYY